MNLLTMTLDNDIVAEYIKKLAEIMHHMTILSEY